MRKSLGTHDIFEYEVVQDRNSQNNSLLVRRSGCACSTYCMSDDYNISNRCDVETSRAIITLNSKTPRAHDETKIQEPIDESNNSNDTSKIN